METNKIEELKKAKDNVRWLLDNADGSIDFHGLTYWAEMVEKLRDIIKYNL